MVALNYVNQWRHSENWSTEVMFSYIILYCLLLLRIHGSTLNVGRLDRYAHERISCETLGDCPFWPKYRKEAEVHVHLLPHFVHAAIGRQIFPLLTSSSCDNLDSRCWPHLREMLFYLLMHETMAALSFKAAFSLWLACFMFLCILLGVDGRRHYVFIDRAVRFSMYYRKFIGFHHKFLDNLIKKKNIYFSPR
jgi:hypothetical protein